jgi:hypothetical protein
MVFVRPIGLDDGLRIALQGSEGDMATNRNQRKGQSDSQWKRDAMIAGAAGLVATLVVVAGSYTVGRATPFQSRQLLDAMMPTSRFLFSGVMTATATILALMLTLLGMTVATEKNVAATFYRRIQQIAFYNMLLLVMSTVFLLLHCVPITESDEIPGWWYPAVYYLLLGSSAVTAGGMVTVVVMLYGAVRDLIHAIGLQTDVGIFIDDETLEDELEDAQPEDAQPEEP